jgi:hypothetical protein
MASIDNQPVGTRETAADRRVQALDLRKAGKSYRAIAQTLGCDVATAHRDVQQALAALAELERQTAEEYRALELARLDMAMEAIATKVAKGNLDAVHAWVRLSESRRKLLGLDKPTLIAPTNPDGTSYSGDYAVLRTAVLAVLAPYPDLRIQIAAQLAALPERIDDDQPTA